MGSQFHRFLFLVALLPACDPGSQGDGSGADENWPGPVSGENGPDEEWRTLISFEEWEAISSFPPLDSVGSVECADGAAQVEEHAFEVNSTYCSFALFDAPIPEDVDANTSLRWRHWHLNLWAAEEAVGTIELFLGEEPLYKAEYAIPGPADFEEVIFPIVDSIPAGTRITLHFRNHGLNSWRFGSIELLNEEL